MAARAKINFLLAILMSHSTFYSSPKLHNLVCKGSLANSVIHHME